MLWPRISHALRIATTTLVLWLPLFALLAQAPASPKPFSKNEIIRLLKGDVSPSRIADLATERGIDFQITPEIEQELLNSGATQDLMAVLRSLAPRPPRPKVEEKPLPSSIYVINQRAFQTKWSSGKQVAEEDARREVLDLLGRFSRAARIDLVVDTSSKNNPLIYATSQIDITQDLLRWSDHSDPAEAKTQGVTTKSGLINIRQAIANTAEGKQAQTELQSRFAPRQTALENLQKQIKDITDRIAAGERSLSHDEMTRLQTQQITLTKQFDEKTNAFQSDANEAMGQVMERIGRKMIDIIDKEAARGGVGLLIDSSTENTPILYAADRLYVTLDIIGFYDLAFPLKDTPKATAKSPPDNKAMLFDASPMTAAVIDIRQAIADTAEGKQAQIELQSRFAPRRTEIENLEKQIKDISDKLGAGERSLGNEEKTRLRGQDQTLKQQLQQKEDALQSDANVAMGQVFDRIGRKMVDVLDKYARENGIGLVLDTGPKDAAVVLYAAEQLDLTKHIRQLYDRAHPTSATSPSRKPDSTSD